MFFLMILTVDTVSEPAITEAALIRSLALVGLHVSFECRSLGKAVLALGDPIAVGARERPIPGVPLGVTCETELAAEPVSATRMRTNERLEFEPLGRAPPTAGRLSSLGCRREADWVAHAGEEALVEPEERMAHGWVKPKLGKGNGRG